MSKEISMQEVKKHRNEGSAWLVVHNDVYDLTRFLNEHPGGPESILEVAGQDATQPFEDVGHSKDAREMMKKYKIGTLPPGEKNKFVDRCCPLIPNPEPHEKTWRTFDGSSASRHSIPKSESKAPSSPRVVGRVQSIVVPRERVRSRRPPRSSDGGGGGSSNLKWALLALAGALVIGFVIKKYAT